MTQDPKAEDVNERIAVISFVKVNLSTNGGDSNTVAVVGDPATTPEKSWRLPGSVSGPNRSEFRKRPARTHRKNIADDATYTGRGALKRFNGAGMIVTFHFERHRPTIADIDHTGIFLSGPHQHPIARGEFPQFGLRIL